MNISMDVLRNNNWIKALFINLLFFAVIILFTDFMYETNDDYAISSRFAEGYAYIGYINYYFCKVMIALQSAFESINVFVAFQILFSFISFTTIIKIILDTDKPKWFQCMTWLILALYMLNHYWFIQFTKTSGLLLVTGTVILVDAIINKKNVCWYTVSVLFVYLGSCLRFTNIYVAAAFAVVCLTIWIVQNKNESMGKGIFEKRRLVFFAITFVLLAGVYPLRSASVAANESTQQLREYREYNSYRAQVIDYPIFDTYDEKKDQYDAAGISENDIRLIRSWYLDYDGAASLENLKTIVEIRDDGSDLLKKAKDAVYMFIARTGVEIRDLEQRGMQILILVMLAAIAFVYFKPKYWIYTIAVGCIAVALYLYLHYVGRDVYRATYTINLAATIWLIYFYKPDFFKDKYKDEKAHPSKKVCALLISFVLLVQIPVYMEISQKYRASLTKEIPADVVEYIEADSDHLYVFATGIKGRAKDYVTPLQRPYTDVMENTISFGGWGTKSPYVQDILAANDLDNLFGDIIDNEKVLVVERENKVDNLEEYFNKWYGNEDIKIEYRYVDTVGDCEVWTVVSRKK